MRFLALGSCMSKVRLRAPGTNTVAVLFDEDPEIEYHTPWEIAVGAAWVTPRWHAEIDLTFFADIERYSPLSSEQPWVIVDELPDGSVATSTARSDAREITPEAVVSVAAGGRVLLGNDVWWQGGLRYDPAPVQDGGLTIDLITLPRAYQSFRRNTSSTLGLHASYGRDTNSDLQNIAGEPVGSGEVAMIGAVIATSFHF